MREDFDEIVGISADGGIVMLQDLFDRINEVEDKKNTIVED